MNTWNNLSLRYRVPILFWAIGIIPVIIIAIFLHYLATDSLTGMAYSQMEAIQSIRKKQIEEFFQEKHREIGLFAETRRLHDLTVALNEAWRSSRLTQNSDDVTKLRLMEAATSYRGILDKLVKAGKYSDAIIMSADQGHILFSNSNTEYLGQSIVQAHPESQLVSAWRKSKELQSSFVSDFDSPGSEQGHSIYVTHPIVSRDGVTLGIFAFQLSAEDITTMVNGRDGMGETGESYLIYLNGEESAYSLRSNVQTRGDGKYIVGTPFETPLDYWVDAMTLGEAGGAGEYRDIIDLPILVAFNKLSISGLDWYLISKVDRKEVLAPLTKAYHFLFFAGVAMLLLIYIGSHFSSRSITEPLFQYIRFAKDIARREAPRPLPANRHDELGELGKALTGMAKDLSEYEKELKQQQAELEVKNEQLEKLSSTDALTGLANRRTFDTTLESEWNRAIRSKTELSLILLDVDHFKIYNDTYGHAEGDKCLKSVADALGLSMKRLTDCAARVGGEEFAAILPNTDSAGAEKIGEAIRNTIADMDIPHANSPTNPHVTVSLGVATFSPMVGDNSGEIYRAADSALYMAKENGRNKVVTHIRGES